MSGAIDHASLMLWEGKGLAWRIAPAYDPDLRVYDVAAVSGGGETNPNDADVYNNRGLDYYNKGQYDQAISDFTKAIELNANDADAY
jgi:tetratricopeptide (TPR) repeat protein